MKRLLILLLTASMLLSGCAFSGRSYVHVTPHSERTAGNTSGSAPAENYTQLLQELQTMVHSGTESGIIYTVKMDEESLRQNMIIAIRNIQETDAIGAYAVESVEYEIGTSGGKTAVAVSVSYRRSRIDIQKVLRLDQMGQVEKAVREALEDFRPSVVMLIANYSEMDMIQLVQDIARRSPQTVMEVPEVSAEVYGSGASRVVELFFAYENSRDALRQMQNQVRPVFDSAALYVSGEGSDTQKLAQLYGFLMERFDYTIETSITPAYSLLRHGVGDSRAFATVYAAMCTRAGLECQVVTGARNGEPWTWNIVRDGERFFHVDLLACRELGYLRKMTDAEMTGYVWDYSAYPACA